MPIFELFVKEDTFNANYPGDYGANLLLKVAISSTSAIVSTCSLLLGGIFAFFFRSIIKCGVLLTNGS